MAMDLNPAKLAPTQRAFSLLDEFKKFAFKGNVIDMAIGVVLGAAFGKLVESLVKDLIMPLVSVVLPGQGGYASWAFELNNVTVPFGRFLGELVNFLIVSFAVFVFMVKILGFLVRKKAESVVPPPPTKSEELLAEIRDLLKKPAC
jgi:large conductance mechanosensitive channel